MAIDVAPTSVAFVPFLKDGQLCRNKECELVLYPLY